MISKRKDYGCTFLVLISSEMHHKGGFTVSNLTSMYAIYVDCQSWLLQLWYPRSRHISVCFEMDNRIAITTSV